jgi:hypothetical protein
MKFPAVFVRPLFVPPVVVPPVFSPSMSVRLRSQRRRASPLLIAAFAGVGAWPACNEPGPRVYTAQPFDPERICLEAYEAIGLVTAEALPSSCEAVCLLVDEQLYVSTVCPPYPLEASILSQDLSPECAGALDAFDQELACDEADAGAADAAP